jgi:hypothetical protein
LTFILGSVFCFIGCFFLLMWIPFCLSDEGSSEFGFFSGFGLSLFLLPLPLFLIYLSIQ